VEFEDALAGARAMMKKKKQAVWRYRRPEGQADISPMKDLKENIPNRDMKSKEDVMRSNERWRERGRRSY